MSGSGSFAPTGPHRLLVARLTDGDNDGSHSAVVGFACSKRYRDHEAFGETAEVSIALTGINA